MQYTFTPSERGTHTRIADQARGFLREYPDTVNVQSNHKVSDPEAYELWREPAPEPVPEPVPVEVLTYKVFGQLAKEVMQGDNEQMQAALTQAGTMTNLLMEMTKAAPEKDIPAVMKPAALNEIERTQTIQRAHPFIDLYGPAFGYATEEQKDQFFIRASKYQFGA